MTPDQVRDMRKKKEYEAIRGFYVHFIVYAGVLALLVAIDVLGGEPTWSHWVALGWGVGIAFHGYGAFVSKPRELAAWEADQLARLGQPT